MLPSIHDLWSLSTGGLKTNDGRPGGNAGTIAMDAAWTATPFVDYTTWPVVVWQSWTWLSVVQHARLGVSGMNGRTVGGAATLLHNWYSQAIFLQHALKEAQWSD